MVKQIRTKSGSKALQITATVSPEEFATLKLALTDITIAALSCDLSPDGRDGLFYLLTFFRPALNDEVQMALEEEHETILLKRMVA